MIFNMAVDNGSGGGGGNNTLALVNNATQNSQEQCAYNFLKRKHDNETSSNEEINNRNANITTVTTTTTAAAAHYQGGLCDDANSGTWKKRHVEDATSASPAENLNSANCFNISGQFNNIINSTTQQQQHIDATIGNLNQNNHNNNNNDTAAVNHNRDDVTYNLIGSSTFISDLFGYDATDLIVPVSVTCAPSNTHTAPLVPATPTFTTVSNVNEPYDENTNWQGTDLLELDHRFTSGLQTEITQLNPTIPMSDGSSGSLVLEAAAATVSQQQQQSPATTTDADFLIPQTEILQSNSQSTELISSSSPTLNKYRTVQNLTNLENLPKSDSNESDFEDKNLSWLLNFKFDDLPHLSPDISGGGNANQKNANGKQNSNSTNPNDRSRSPKNSTSTTTTKTGKKFEELVMEVTAELDGNDMIVAENVIVEDTPIKPIKKPPFTYTELIEYALEDKGELTVSGIYQWISDRFPYYKSNDDRWKNSVRHNLSINPHFRKGSKAPQGAGHLWTISSGDSAENVLAWEHKKQRLELFFKMESMNRERLQQHQQQQQLEHQQKQQQQQQQQQSNGECCSPHLHENCQNGQCLYEEAAKAVATITEEIQQQQQQQSSSTSESIGAATQLRNLNDLNHHQRLANSQILQELPFNDLLSDEELRKTAGQILNGIHREVEVQSVNSIIATYHDVLLDNDYLNPIHKDIVVNESGLRHTLCQQSSSHHQHNNNNNHHHQHSSHQNSSQSQYYLTEIDPLELGIQINPMSHHPVHEEEVLFNDDFNLNYFTYNAGNDIVA